MNRLVLGDSILDRTSDKLLDLLRRSARPRTEGHCDSDRNVRVLPLGHAVVAKPTPSEDTHEKHPRYLWVLHKEPGEVVGFVDSILVVFVCHGVVCLRNRLDGVAIPQKLSTYGDHSLAGLDSFNSKDSVSYVSGWRNACNPPLHRSGIILCLDRQFLP